VRAAVLTGREGRLETTEVDDPVPGPGQVVAKVTGCGICGSDLHIASAFGVAGTVMGHEIAGVIDQVGQGVEARWTPGMAVTARPFASCGQCAACRRGRADHCPEFQLVGFARPGGFAELVALSSDELYALPASLTGPDQALVEPLAVARHGLRRAGLRPGEAPAVLGGGPIGLATTAWARALNAGPVLVSDPVAHRRELATKLGADAVVDPNSSDMAGVCATALGGAPSLVMECSGKPGLIDQAMSLCGVEGRVAVVGACMRRDAIVPYTGLFKELDVRFAVYYDRQDFVDTLRALDGGTLVVDGLVTDVISLDALPEVFASLATGGETGKVVVAPER